MIIPLTDIVENAIRREARMATNNYPQFLWIKLFKKRWYLKKDRFGMNMIIRQQDIAIKTEGRALSFIMNKEERKIVFLTATGGALEFYDFTIYALFAPYIQQHFFSNPNVVTGFFQTFLVFALGYIARPIGGIFFGHIGDRFGRKRAFSWAIFLMAISTLCMGCLPDEKMIGGLAPIILMSLRLVQGFSVGGEIPGAAIFIIEHMPKNKIGVAIGLVFMSITLGNTLAALMGFFLTTFLNETQMMMWGWRIPFISGFLLAIFSYFIRRKMHETPIFVEMIEKAHSVRKPFWNLWKGYSKVISRGFFLTAATSSIISLYLYLPTYLSTVIKIEMSHAYLMNVVSFLSFALMTAFFGKCSEKIARETLLLIGSFSLILFSYPLFYGLNFFNERFIFIFILFFSLFGGMINGSYLVLITTSFPPFLRYSGVGFSYSLGVALFGGVAPLAFSYFIQFFNFNEAPALYMIGASSLTFFSTWSFQAWSRHRECVIT